MTTRLTTNLGAIANNIDTLQRWIAPVRLMLSVKANAYGHGAVAVAKIAQAMQVHALAVATVAEGVELRQSNIHLPILKLYKTSHNEIEEALDHQLTLTVFDADNILAIQRSAALAHKKVPVHLKLDTGLGRIGAPSDAAHRLVRLIREDCPNLRLAGIYTHFAASDDSSLDHITKQQLATFKTAIADLPPPFLRHAANSAATLYHPETHLDMVRVGLAVYGITTGSSPIPLRAALEFTSRLTFIKRIQKGTSIGYGCTWRAPHDTYVGTFPAGYADGVNRLLSNKGSVVVAGARCPIVGRISMDQTVCDLNQCPYAKVDDLVYLLGGKGPDVHEWSNLLNTIPYEVLCQIGNGTRTERVYLDSNMAESQ